MPYKNQEQVIQGVVITFSVAKELKVMQESVQRLQSAGLIVETAAQSTLQIHIPLEDRRKTRQECPIFFCHSWSPFPLLGT
jgi:hypothetical protein